MISLKNSDDSDLFLLIGEYCQIHVSYFFIGVNSYSIDRKSVV